MTGTIDRRIAWLRGRLRRAIVLRGASWTVFAAASAFLLVTWTDWFVPLAWDVRAASLAAVLALVGWVAWRELIRPLSLPLDDLRLALLIERRWPGLNDALSSTIAFLKARGMEGGDGRHGSTALRELTIERAIAEVEALEFGLLIDQRPLRHAATMAAWMLAVLLVVSIAAPEFQSIAARRFLLGDVPWPRRTALEIVEAPEKLARGMAFEVVAEVGPGRELPVVPPRVWAEALGRVLPPLALLGETIRDHSPGTARIRYRFEGGEVVDRPLRPDDSGAFHGRLDLADRSFTYAISAGDDRTAWQSVAVVPPPTLDAMTIQVAPPFYVHPYADGTDEDFGVETLAADQGQIRALEGSMVRFRGRANKPLAEASLMDDDAPLPVAVAFDADRLRLDATIEALGPGSLWFALRDLDGFDNAETVRYELRTVADAPPSALIVEPEYDISVPPNASVPIRLRGEDDYGLQLIRLLYTVNGGDSAESTDHVVPLWASEAELDGGRSLEQEVETRLELAELGVEPGDLITAYAESRDFFDRGIGAGPHLTKSRAVRIRIISIEEFEALIDDRRREIREELERIAEMQDLAIPPVRDAINELDASGRVQQETGDELREAAVIQRQVGSRFEEPGSGLSDRIQQLLDDLKNAQQADSEVAEQMEAMKGAVDRVRADHLRPAEQGLSRASKQLEPPDGEPGADAAEPPPSDADETRGSLVESQSNQQAIARELDAMLEGLSQFETLRGVTQDAEKLLDDQQAATEDAQRLGNDPSLMGKDPEQLPADRQADLQNLGARQRDVAQGLQDLTGRLSKMSESLAESDPIAAEALKESLDQLRREGASGTLKKAAEQIDRNQMGAASKSQDEGEQALRDLVDALKNRRENDLERIVKQLKETRADLAKMQQAEAGLLKKTQQAGADGQDDEAKREELQKLAKQQQQLEQELGRQLQKLRKLRAERAARAGAKAASGMAKAGQELDDGEAQEAQQGEEDALQDLEQAIAETDQAIQEAQDKLLMEQFAKIADQLRAYNDRQKRLLEETVAFEGRRDGGRLSRADAFDVKNLGRAQVGLRGETGSLAERLDGAPVFKLALERAVGRMEDAADGLDKIRTGDDTQGAERDASRWLERLVESLAPPKGDENGGQQGKGGQPGQPGQGQQGGDGIPAEAQIRMLKMMQQEINLRTMTLDELKAGAEPLTEAQELEFVRLEEDQHAIGDLLRDLVRPKRPDGLED